MHGALFDVACFAVAAFVGGCLYLFCANRILMLYRDSVPKTVALVLLAVLLTVGTGLLTLQLPPRTRLWTLATIVASVLSAEIRHRWLRHQLTGSRPLDTVPHPFQLSRPMTTLDLVTHRYRIRIPKWRGPPLRIAQVSDLHVNEALPAAYYRQVLEEAAKTEPDLVFMPGDFVTEAHALPMLASLLRPIGRLGAFGVLGNHDYWAGEDAVRNVVTKAGIRLLYDESIELDVAGHTLTISGVDYPWHGGPCNVTRVPADRLHLVLSHSPDNIYRLSRMGVDCVFSGHIHAGQFRIPWFGSFVSPSLYGRRFDHGYFLVRDTHLFVASGVGAACPPFRIYCQPDIFVIEIVGGQPSGCPEDAPGPWA